ncbi:MAG: hypothetical protein HY904_10725 [Deltaproteobacteria bacterium]|nr:hypothetical protein [Deltaproteobacteria bacterium]
MTTTTKAGNYVGAALGFLGFLAVGALPSSLFGAYIGMFFANVLLGLSVETSIAAKVITGGGMLLGFTAAMALFVVAGAVLGGVTAWLFESPKEPVAAHVEQK